MFERELAYQCQQFIKQYPIVTIMGPRQSGKTTLVKALFPDYAYINMEEPEMQLLAEQDPKALLNKYRAPLIIDEVQRAPQLLSYIQVIVDEQQDDGMYILTGSHQLELHEAVSQSLAGRTAILEMLPLSFKELSKANIELSTNERILNGCYPRVYNKNLDPTIMYRNYVKTYLERDVRKMIHLKDLLTFQRFMKLCAARTGCILNMNNLANEVGVSNHTIKHWISILQASYLMVLLPPYFENINKQVIKSPKLYFTDVGLASYLLGIESINHVDRDPLRGQLFETMVVIEAIKSRLNIGKDPNLYFYRDSKLNEVDLIYKSGSQLIPIEIKSAETINRGFFKGLNYFQNLLGPRCGQSYLVYAGTHSITMEHAKVINYRDIAQVTSE